MVKRIHRHKDKTVETLSKLIILYSGRKMAVPAQNANVVERRRRVTELDRDLDEKELQLPTLLDLDQKNATLC